MNNNRRTVDKDKMSKEVERKVRNKAAKKYNKRASRETSKEEVDKLNDRKDLMSRPEDGRNNLPGWYIIDPVLADQISRFSFNQFAGLAKPYDRYVAGAMRMGYNPSPGTTTVLGTSTSAWQAAATEAQNKGINMAALKWWSLLASTSGRGATYTRNDIAILFLAIGEIISMYEYIRRFFGLLNAYSLRNRVLPQGLLEVAGVDADNFVQNQANYRLRVNNLITRINQLPIPSNISYFAKCQDMYQHIYADSDSPMAQFYVPVPISTWVVDETSASMAGTILRTTPVVGSMTDSDQTTGCARLEMLLGTRQLSQYIDILENQINTLIMSSTFSVIYSDLIRLAEKTNLNFWSFDTIKEDYVVVPEYNSNALLQIHNTTVMPCLNSQNTKAMITDLNASPYVPSGNGITLNDVICEATCDVVLYNPVFNGQAVSALTTASMRGISLTDARCQILFDSPSSDPDINDRIDGTRYLCAPDPSAISGWGATISAGSDTCKGYDNFTLPDHWCGGAYTYKLNTAYQNKFTLTVSHRILGQYCERYYTNFDDAKYYASELAAFDWCPQAFNNYTDSSSEDAGLPSVQNAQFDVNFYTILDFVWLKNVTDSTYIALFEIR